MIGFFLVGRRAACVASGGPESAADPKARSSAVLRQVLAE